MLRQNNLPTLQDAISNNLAIKLTNQHAPGDCTVLAFAAQSLQRFKPDIKIEIGCGIPELFSLNWRASNDKANGYRPSVSFKPTADAGISYPVQMTRSLSALLGANIPFDFAPPIFNLTPDEQQPVFNHPYLILNSGRKQNDGDCKFWGTHNWQAVVDGLADHIPIIQVGSTSDIHPKLNGTINHIGKTSIRQLLSLVSHPNCLAVLSQITFVYWLAVAQGKQTFTVCNAREHPDFLRVLDGSRFYFAEPGTYGCRLNNCFRIRTYKHRDGNWRDKDQHQCLAPRKIGLEMLPACALAIDPKQIVADVLDTVCVSKTCSAQVIPSLV